MSMNEVSNRGAGAIVAKAAVAAGCMLAGPALPQAELFKCTDGVSTTYASSACEKLGLKSAGAIRDRLTVVGNGPPAAKPEPAKAQVAAKPPATEQEEQRARRAAAGLKPINPLIDRLLK